MRDILGDVGQIDRDGLVATGNRLEHFIDDQRGISKAQQCLVMLDQQCLRREAGTAYRQEQQEPAHHVGGRLHQSNRRRKAGFARQKRAVGSGEPRTLISDGTRSDSRRRLQQAPWRSFESMPIRCQAQQAWARIHTSPQHSPGGGLFGCRTA